MQSVSENGEYWQSATEECSRVCPAELCSNHWLSKFQTLLIQKILHNLSYYPYKIQIIQCLRDQNKVACNGFRFWKFLGIGAHVLRLLIPDGTHFDFGGYVIK